MQKAFLREGSRDHLEFCTAVSAHYNNDRTEQVTEHTREPEETGKCEAEDKN